MRSSCVAMIRVTPRSARKAEREGDDFLAGARIKIAGRLVGENEIGMIDKGAGDGDALLLAAG